jgi:Tol biopolymer transport system component/DNA-binding winged helix-turn-helix (wHTH) protein
MSNRASGLYEFGSYRLDLAGRLLTRDGRVVALAPKTFELLLLMVQSPGRAFSKQELMTAMWHDTFVEEANLSFQISVLRKALGEDGVRWIETVPKHGYRFGGDVKVIPSADRGSGASAEVSSLSTPSRVISAGKRKRWIAGIAAASALAVVSYLVLSQGSRTEPIRTPTAVAVPLTAYQGFELDPSLSPDGSQVAFSWNGPTEDNYDIYVKLAGPGEAVRLTTNPARDDNPAWSPDGRLIAFQRSVSEVTKDVFVVPALGGAERQVATISVAGLGMSSALAYNATHTLSWTPDGRWIAFGGRPSEQESPGIWLTAVDRSERRRLTTVGGHDFGDTSPAFSHDGRLLAFVREHTISASEVYVLLLSSALMPVGAPARVTPEGGLVRGVAWVPGGDGLVFSVQGHLGLSRLHRVALAEARPEPVGPPELLPFGEQATAISVSRTGRLVYSAQFRDASLWNIPLTGRADRPVATPIVRSTFDEQAPDYSPDGTRLAFASTRSGVEEIWVANADGSNPVQVTSMGGPLCSNPQWSPDSQTILLNAHREGSSDLYLLRPDSGYLRRITDHPAEEIEGRWSRDGHTIYFASNRTGRFEVWKMPAAGGASVRITQGGGMTATESPDGRVLYYAKHDAQPTAIWRVPVNGGEERSIVDGLSYSMNFVVANRGLYFVAVGDAPHQTSIDFFDYATGQRTTLLALGKQYWWGMALSPDQRSLLYSVIDSAGSNLMLVDTFQ